jgi:Rieske Fe-S protein
MERRKFIKNCCVAAIGAPLAAYSLTSCGGLHYATATALPANTPSDGGSLRIGRSEFEISAEKSTLRDFVLISSETMPFPICVYRLDKEGRKFAAALMKCTHFDCELQVAGQLFVCPCHGSEFATDGTVRKGPADQDLLTFNTRIDDAFIYIEKSGHSGPVSN